MTDTLSLDTTIVSRWTQNGDYDYERELARSGHNAWQRLVDGINDFLSQQLGLSNVNIDSTVIIIIVGVVLAALLVAFIVVKRPKLFFSDKPATDYEVEDDNIYGIDFDTLIAQAIDAENWRQACRLSYLRLLRQLSDNGLITWQISKTPTQFAREYPNPDFSRMTNLFLRIRYGGYATTRSDYELMDRLATQTSTIITATSHED